MEAKVLDILIKKKTMTLIMIDKHTRVEIEDRQEEPVVREVGDLMVSKKGTTRLRVTRGVNEGGDGAEARQKREKEHHDQGCSHQVRQVALEVFANMPAGGPGGEE